jgi:hypothetical protein
MRIICPDWMRASLLTRPPSTRTWPERRSFWSWAEAEARIVDLEPPVEAHARLVVLHLSLFDACHLRLLSLRVL